MATINNKKLQINLWKPKKKKLTPNISNDRKEQRVKMRPEKVQIVSPSLSTITPYHLIFIKIGTSILKRT